jgi:predicted PurR-regulated permease PerM
MLGVANIVPYFGSIFGSMLAVFITFFSNGWETALLTAIILLITQQFDGYFINPRIMGTSFKLSPIIVIIAITVGGALGGVAGMIFAIPVVNVLKTVMDEFLETREKKLSLTIYD